MDVSGSALVSSGIFMKYLTLIHKNYNSTSFQLLYRARKLAVCCKDYFFIFAIPFPKRNLFPNSQQCSWSAVLNSLTSLCEVCCNLACVCNSRLPTMLSIARESCRERTSCWKRAEAALCGRSPVQRPVASV